MEIPDSIKAGGHIITIEKVPSKDIQGLGEYNNYYNVIRLSNDSDTIESNISETFLHEIIEMIKWKNNLEIDHTHLTVLSENLFAILRDNKLDFGKGEICG